MFPFQVPDKVWAVLKNNIPGTRERKQVRRFFLHTCFLSAKQMVSAHETDSGDNEHCDTLCDQKADHHSDSYKEQYKSQKSSHVFHVPVSLAYFILCREQVSEHYCFFIPPLFCQLLCLSLTRFLQKCLRQRSCFPVQNGLQDPEPYPVPW